MNLNGIVSELALLLSAIVKIVIAKEPIVVLTIVGSMVNGCLLFYVIFAGSVVADGACFL